MNADTPSRLGKQENCPGSAKTKMLRQDLIISRKCSTEGQLSHQVSALLSKINKIKYKAARMNQYMLSSQSID